MHATAGPSDKTHQFGVWGWGLGVEGLGFGVWGLGFGCGRRGGGKGVFKEGGEGEEDLLICSVGQLVSALAALCWETSSPLYRNENLSKSPCVWHSPPPPPPSPPAAVSTSAPGALGCA